MDNVLDNVKLSVEFYFRKLRSKAILALGGYDQAAVSHLVYSSRRLTLELESLGAAGFLRTLNKRVQSSIYRVDPELGKIYGYRETFRDIIPPMAGDANTRG